MLYTGAVYTQRLFDVTVAFLFLYDYFGSPPDSSSPLTTETTRCSIDEDADHPYLASGYEDDATLNQHIRFGDSFFGDDQVSAYGSMPGRREEDRDRDYRVWNDQIRYY